MPTSRFFAFLIISFLLYFFANQTQVGWLYVMSALLAGVLLAAYLNGKKMLTGIKGERQIGRGVSDEYFEGDDVEIRLKFRNNGIKTAVQVKTSEQCPLADPSSDLYKASVFIPEIDRQNEVELNYQVEIYKRGIYEFAAHMMSSSAPFGIFRNTRKINVPSKVIVYPEVQEINQFRFLDRQPAEQKTQRRTGLGVEIMGVRPYRPGDSPRHIHWRSVARTGRLISKEFADESQPGLVLALDLFPYDSHPEIKAGFRQVDKNTPFEWMVKAAASVGDYALRHGYPLHILTDETAWPAPTGALTKTAMLEFLARIHPAGSRQLSEFLSHRVSLTYVAVFLPWPDESIVVPLNNLLQRGISVLAVIMDPSSFPIEGAISGHSLANILQGMGIETHLIQFGENLVGQLSPKDEMHMNLRGGEVG